MWLPILKQYIISCHICLLPYPERYCKLCGSLRLKRSCISVARVNLKPGSTQVTSQSRVNLESSQIFFFFFLNRKNLFGYVLSTKRTINNRLTLVQHDRATPFCYYICTQKILGSLFCAHFPTVLKMTSAWDGNSVCIILSRPRSRLLASIFIYLQWKKISADYRGKYLFIQIASDISLITYL